MLKYFDILKKSFSLISNLPCACSLVVDGIVDSEDKKEEKIREVADIMMYHICCGNGGGHFFCILNMWDSLKVMCDDGR